MKNNFDKVELTRWFIDNWECWECEQNHMNCFHHIVGRGAGDSKLESSILNAAPLNNHKCHLPIHGKLRTEDKMGELLMKTFTYLIYHGYKPNEKDRKFFEKYNKFYEGKGI